MRIFAHLDISDFLRFYLSIILQFKSNPPMPLMPSAVYVVVHFGLGYWYPTKSIAIRYSVAMLLPLLLLFGYARHCFNNHYVQSTFYFSFCTVIRDFLFLLQFYHILVQIIHLLYIHMCWFFARTRARTLSLSLSLCVFSVFLLSAFTALMPSTSGAYVWCYDTSR